MHKKKIALTSLKLSQEQRQAVETMIKERLDNDRLPCGQAKTIAETLGVTILVVGQIADQLKIRISQCQLGCF